MAKNMNMKRPMTKIEKSIEGQVYKEFDKKFGYVGRNHYKVTMRDLLYPIDLAIGGVSIRKWNHQECYQYWCQDETKPWIGPQNFRKLYERVQQLVTPCQEEIDNAIWYRVNAVVNGKQHSQFVNLSLDEIKQNLSWIDVKPTSIYTATWDGNKFHIGTRVSLPA